MSTDTQSDNPFLAQLASPMEVDDTIEPSIDAEEQEEQQELELLAEDRPAEAPLFFEPKLDNYRPDSFFANQKFTSKLLERLKMERILVLGGAPDVDKSGLARHLACLLGDPLSQEKRRRSSEKKNLDEEDIDEDAAFLKKGGDLKDDYGEGGDDFFGGSGGFGGEKRRRARRLLADMDMDDVDDVLPPDFDNMSDEEFDEFMRSKKELFRRGMEDEGVDDDDDYRSDWGDDDEGKKRRRKRTPEVDSGRMQILEWRRPYDALRLIDGIFAIHTPTVFILPHIRPQDIKFDLDAVRSAAQRNGHYVIISTEVYYKHWKVSGELRKAFLGLKDVYGDGLIKFLLKQLEDWHDSLPHELRNEFYDPDRRLFGQYYPKEICQELASPEKLSVFVQLLCRHKTRFNDGVVRELVKQTRESRSTLQQWYQHALDNREQMLALALGFFDGLMDDQFFAAMEEVINKAWHLRDPSLRTLDYADLHNLRTFYHTVEAKRGDGVRFESRLSSQRGLIFRAAWNRHRRQLYAALPVLVQMVRDSIINPSRNPELMGHARRREALRNCIAEAIGDLSYLAYQQAEGALLQLAADEEPEVQAVAARALARWRAHGPQERLVITLSRWLTDNRMEDRIAPYLKGRKDAKEPKEYLMATVTLAIGYAAEYDAPGRLSGKLINLLQDLVQRDIPIVRERLKSHTLRLIIPQHLRQLRDYLKNFTRFPDLCNPIAKGLALALRTNWKTNHREVVATLEVWYGAFSQWKPLGTRGGKVTEYDLLLATVAMTYGEIHHDPRNGQLAAQALENVKKILKNDAKHPNLKRMIILALSLQIKDGPHYEGLLLPLMRKFNNKEQERVADLITELYLDERQDQRGGDDVIELGRRSIPVWTNGDRPPTAVEVAINRWLRDSKNPGAQRVAALAKVKWAKVLDQQEWQLLKKKQDERGQGGDKEKDRDKKKRRPYRLGGLPSFLASALATFPTFRYCRVIQGLLPAVMAEHQEDGDALKFVLKQWRKGPDKDLQKITKKLIRAARMAQHKWLLVGGFYALVLGASFTVGMLYRLGMLGF